MTHIPQHGKPVCYLATIAMLTGKTLETVHSEANTIAKLLGVKRGGYMYLVNRGKNRYDRECRTYTWRALEKVFTNRYGIPSITWHVYAPAWTANTPDLSGKGTIELRMKGKGHVVAYAAGMVFDGDAVGPLPYEEWRTWLRKHSRPLIGLTIKAFDETKGSIFLS